MSFCILSMMQRVAVGIISAAVLVNSGCLPQKQSPAAAAAAVTQVQQDTGVSVQLTPVNDWQSEGLYFTQYDCTLQNHTAVSLTGWSVEITPPAGSNISQNWNCTFVQQGQHLTLTPAEYAQTIAAEGQSTGIGFIMSCPSQETLTAGTVSYKTADAVTETPAPSSDTTVTATVPHTISPLHVSGTHLVDAQGNIVQLRGVSTHGLAWYPQYVNQAAFQTLRDSWGINTVRLAMYTAEYGGYCNGGDRTKLKQLIDQGVQAASALDLYVIIDWHILSDGNPNTYKKDALAFFDEMSAKYADYPNVFYEICNEPNGADWNTAIKPYAESVLQVIRKHAPNAIVLVGTNTWSQDVDAVIGNRLADPNVLYTLHFYAGTHKEALRQKLQTALSAGIPVFVSECGITDASGNGSLDTVSAQAWLQMLQQNGIGFIAWNLSNKDESSSLLRADCQKASGWTEEDLSESGKWFQNAIKTHETIK